MTSRINDQTSSLKDLSLSARVEKINEALAERKALVEEGTQVLQAAASSLQGVRRKYEPVKAHSNVLASTSTNVIKCSEEVVHLLSCLKVHEKLDKAINRPTADRNDAILNTMKEVSEATNFLLKLDHLPTAINAVVRNRQSLSHAAAYCSNTYDRMLKANSTMPGTSDLKSILATPFDQRPDAMLMFFGGKEAEVQAMSRIMAAMIRADDRTCLKIYTTSRQKAVAGLLQSASAVGGGAVPAAAQQQRQMHEWSHQVHMLAQTMNWEIQLVQAMLPISMYGRTLDTILAQQVKSTIERGYSLAEGRANPERLFPLLDAIACMHDPFVLPAMKRAFKEDSLKPMKQQFHDLLTYQYEQAQNCVESFSASIAGSIQLRKEVAHVVSVSLQTAFVIRVLKSMFRREIFGKLPFLKDAQVFTSDTIGLLLRALEQKVQVAVKDPAAVAIAMMNNIRYIIVGVMEHEQLPSILGTDWRESQKRRIDSFRKDYFQVTWQPFREVVDAARAEASPDAKKDNVKEHCRRINLRLEKIMLSQAEWTVPDNNLKAELKQQVMNDIVLPYNNFWNAYSGLQLLQNPQKHFKYTPQEVKDIVATVVLGGAPLKPGLIKK